MHKMDIGANMAKIKRKRFTKDKELIPQCLHLIFHFSA